jgi:hypothetical protein
VINCSHHSKADRGSNRLLIISFIHLFLLNLCSLVGDIQLDASPRNGVQPQAAAYDARRRRDEVTRCHPSKSAVQFSLHDLLSRHQSYQSWVPLQGLAVSISVAFPNCTHSLLWMTRLRQIKSVVCRERQRGLFCFIQSYLSHCRQFLFGMYEMPNSFPQTSQLLYYSILSPGPVGERRRPASWWYPCINDG